MAKEKTDIKFRTTEITLKRLKWGVKCHPDLGSQNKVIEVALNAWLEENESIYGPPQEEPRPAPLARQRPHVVPSKRKRVGE